MKRIIRTLLFSLMLLMACSAFAQEEFANSWKAISSAQLKSYSQLSSKELTKKLKNDSVKIVIFWADWCEFCDDEMARMSNLEKTLGPEKLAILAVNVDEKFDPNSKKAKQYGDQLVMIHDEGLKLKQKLGIQKLPMTLVFEKNQFKAAYTGFSGERFGYIRKRVLSMLNQAEEM